MVSRERIYAIVSSDNESDKIATIYNIAMVILIVLWMIPLWTKESNPFFTVIDYACTAVFIIDYLLRWATADFKLKRGKASFILYPFTPMAIVDLLSLLPVFVAANNSLKAIRFVRVFGALRAFKLIHHSRSIHLLLDAVRSQRKPLLVAFALAVIYVVVSATFMFNVEPSTFDSFVDALYWSVISLTTIGYGDFYPTSEPGRVVAMISALAGVAIISFPSAIIAAALISKLNKTNFVLIDKLDKTDPSGSKEPDLFDSDQAE